MVLENSCRRWENAAPEKIKNLPGKYLYLSPGSDTPDRERIGMMLRRALPADLIVPVPHSAFPQAEALEEPLTGPFPVMAARFRLTPLLNGCLVRKSWLLRCLQENRHDWIHAPCPDFFLLFGLAPETGIVRMDRLADPDELISACRSWRSASGWLSDEFPGEGKDCLQRALPDYADSLIDAAVAREMSTEQLREWFPLPLIAHCFFERHPERLPSLKFSPSPIRTGAVRNLAVVCWALRGGGAERCVSLLLKYFAGLPGMKITLIQCSPPAPGDYECPGSVEQEVVPFRFQDRYPKLISLLREKQIDTCIFTDHSQPVTFYDLLTARELGIRTVAMEHSTFTFPLYIGDPGLLALRQAVYAGTDVVTCLSRSDEYLWNHQGIRARYLPNPLTFDTSNRQAFVPRQGKNLIFIGRLVPGKGVQDALQVVERVKTVHPEVKLFVLGSFPDPAYEREIHEWVDKHGLTDQVEFTGFTREVEKYVSRSAVHLMPSCVEGYPMTLMEVKSCGVPTVSYSLPYLEAGKEEYGTLSVPRGDREAMAAKVSELLDAPAVLNEYGQKAWESLKLFDNAMVFGRWQFLFRWLETGAESAELSPPELPADRQLELLGMQTREIISGISAMDSSPYCRRQILNRLVAEQRKNDGLLDLLFRMYFSLRKKLSDGAPRSLRVLFSGFWKMKKTYRLLKPWKDEEQDL